MKQKWLRLSLYMGLLLVLLFVWHPVSAAETEKPASTPQDAIVQGQLERLDTKDIEAFWQKVLDKYGGYLPESEGKSLFEMVTGEKAFSLSGVIQGLGSFLFHELLINGKLLGAILIITVFAMVLETLQTAFEKNSVSTVAYAISYLVLIILAVNSFRVAIDFAQGAIQDMVGFMLALMPLILALLASTGGITSVALFHPMVVFLVNTSGTLISIIVFPLLFLSTVLSIVSSFSVKYQLTRLAQLLRTISLGLMGSFLTIFLAVLSLQGATAAVADGVALRTAKYIAGNFIPVVGRVFADAAETVVGASLLVKNAVGMAGVLVLLLLVAFPALKILILAFVYNLSSAVMQPLGNSPILSCLGIIGKNLLYIFAALATVSLMFFLAITIVISAANVSVMMR